MGAVSKGALDVIAARLRRRPTGAARTLTGALRSFLDARFGLFLACLIGGTLFPVAFLLSLLPRAEQTLGRFQLHIVPHQAVSTAV